MKTKVVKSCDCTQEFVNGHYITITCDKCEAEMETLLQTPVYFRKTKMRQEREI